MIKTVMTLIAALAVFCLGASGAERPDSLRGTHYIGADISPAWLLPTNSFFRGDRYRDPMSSHFSMHLKYGYRFGPASRLGRLHPHAVQGVGVSWNTFGNAYEVGRPVAIYVFQTSRLAGLGERLTLDYEWNFGASFGWKKYDPKHNPDNTVVGSSVNAYINLGLLLNWQFAQHWNLRAGVGMTHFSNGNTSLPNAGVNSVGLRIGASRSFGEAAVEPVRRMASTDVGPQRRVSWDVTVFGAWRKKYRKVGDKAQIAPGSFAVAGMNVNPLYRVSSWFKAGLSLDARFDESANIWDHMADGNEETGGDLRFHRPPFREQFSMGLSARAEFTMPIFSINVGIGKNFICQGADTDKFYQDIALKTALSRRLFLYVGYQLYNFSKPDHLMLGIGVRL